MADMITDIYKVGPLIYPKIFQYDNASEFKEVTKMLEKHELTIKCVKTKYKYTHTAFVETLNKLLAEQLFKVRDAQDLIDPERVSSTWVKYQYRLIDQLDDTEMQIIGMSPKDAIKLKGVPLAESYSPDDKLPGDGLYCYLLQPGQEHGDQRKRAMDRTWSKTFYGLREVMKDSGNCVMYYLSGGPKRAFVSEELMLIPEDTELLLDYVQKW